MSTLDLAPDCFCGDPRGAHKRGIGGCKVPDCGCGKYQVPGMPREPEARPTPHLDRVKAERDELAARLADVERERDELRDALPCGWCDGLGVAPGERFGRDADGAPNVDEDRPCPEGCEIPAWLQAERNDAADDARQLAEAREEIAQLYKNEEIRAQVIRERNAQRAAHEKRIAELEALLEQAQGHSRHLQDEVLPEAIEEATRALRDEAASTAQELLRTQDELRKVRTQTALIFIYEAWQCLDGSVNCSRRYFADDPDHMCGPLTPVTVTVSRRPAPDTTKNRSTTA